MFSFCLLIDGVVLYTCTTTYAMASAGFNCCSIVCQLKCLQRFQMFQPIRKPAFAIAFI